VEKQKTLPFSEAGKRKITASPGLGIVIKPADGKSQAMFLRIGEICLRERGQ
jgi:hypothetical protein